MLLKGVRGLEWVYGKKPNKFGITCAPYHQQLCLLVPTKEGGQPLKKMKTKYVGMGVTGPLVMVNLLPCKMNFCLVYLRSGPTAYLAMRRDSESPTHVLGGEC